MFGHYFGKVNSFVSTFRLNFKYVLTYLLLNIQYCEIILRNLMMLIGKSAIEDEPPKIPDPPSKPWSCLHCTYVNPPGIHICEVCCKTSYGNTNSENQNEGRSLDSRNSDSPMELVNLDALSQSPDFIKHRAQKVI